ncbi:MAG: hypothetical protein A2092_10925 [Rhodobacteraceae bacterium GWE1_64_9]|mgnify:CR=1 FL=1|nr:MAG: hypothetical protein A2092_10925 [Rhodobacteraceae bacterium GWE1_64_9]OHC50630.1 MAG: hypothetical protein A2X69_18500 [Rhodobacteraceae bacterium GWF1_65_7]HBD89922.1 hypothetical protein [Gemmobacter sp.]HBU16304.1 hypothetical protein [Gemmobacter sp.]
MTKFSALLAAGAMLVSASTAFAGGPVVIETEPEVPVVVGPTSSFGGGLAGAAIPAALALATIAIVASDSGEGSH